MRLFMPFTDPLNITLNIAPILDVMSKVVAGATLLLITPPYWIYYWIYHCIAGNISSVNLFSIKSDFFFHQEMAWA